MTENRELYLKDISSKERFIRKELARQKHLLKIAKYRLTYERFEDMILIYEEDVAAAKCAINALKKQLPVSVKFSNTYFYQCCPICENSVMNDEYCSECGQKLR